VKRRAGEGQLSLLDALAARDSGIEDAWRGASAEWKEHAWRFLVAYLETHATLFADDLWKAGLPETRENRALGPLILRARRAGMIEESGNVRVSVRAHAQRHNVWRSLIYRNGAA
jgi:hypothetical protein